MTLDREGHAEVSEAWIIITLFLALILSTVTFSIRDIKRTNHFVTKASIALKDTTIDCIAGSGLIYLGKTDNFVFIYNNKRSKGVAIPTAEVKRYVFY
jgi:hypothetical protein